MKRSEAAPRSAQSLRRKLDHQLRAAASMRGGAPEQVRKQFVFSLFYKRLFAREANRQQWLLLGGNALLIRTGGGRFTQDIDLARSESWANETVLREELASVCDAPSDDEFRFEVIAVRDRDNRDEFGYGSRSAEARVKVWLGNREFDSFKIDITQRRHVAEPVDLITPDPVIDDVALAALPTIPVVPVENHLADKLCAMYALYKGGSRSTRHRDLADVVRIVAASEISAARLQQVLAHEQRRRRMQLPAVLEAPSDDWRTYYPRQAATFANFPRALHDLDASLEFAARCVNPVLNASRTSGMWNPNKQVWAD